MRRVPAAARGGDARDPDVAVPRDGRGVDVVRRLVEDRLEEALGHGGRHRVRIDRERTGELDLELLHAAPAQLGRRAPQDLAELQVRAQCLHHLRRERGSVHHAARVVAVEGEHRPLEDLRADARLRLGGVRTEVCAQHHVVAPEQRQRRVGRLRHVHVEPGTEEPPRVERLEQGVLADDPAPGGVDHDRSLGQAAQLVRADHALGLLGQRGVDGEEVRTGQHGVQVVEQLDLQLLGPPTRDVGIERHDRHPQPLRTPGHERADPAEPDDAETRALELTTEELAVPRARPDEAVGARHAARGVEHQRHGQLRRGHVVRLRRVHDQDAAAARRLEVDVVDAHAAAPDHAEPGPRPDQLVIDLRATARDDRVERPDDVQELLPGDARTVDDLHVRVRGVTQLDGVGDKDSGHTAEDSTAPLGQCVEDGAETKPAISQSGGTAKESTPSTSMVSVPFTRSNVGMPCNAACRAALASADSFLGSG